MTDVLSKEQRHKNMQNIKGTDSRPEVVLRKALWSKGHRYRKNYKKLPGKPDIVFPKYKLCVFVDSEFFHGKNFDNGYESKKYNSLREQLENSDNSEFWLNKIKRNMERDGEVNLKLQNSGWTVIRFWSKEALKHTDNYGLEIEKVLNSKEQGTSD